MRREGGSVEMMAEKGIEQGVHTGTLRNPEELTDKELLVKMDELSSKVHFSRNRFIAYLPEIKKRRLWDDGRFTSVFHYANVKACLTDGTIERVFKTYDKVQEYPEILKLFQKAVVGWSKIEIVASVLNKRNARHFASRLLNNTTSTLKRLAKNIRQRNSGKSEVGSANKRANSGVSSAIGGNNNSIRHADRAKDSALQVTLPIVGAEAQSRPASNVTQASLLDKAAVTSQKPGYSRRLVSLNVTPVVRDMYERLLHKWKQKDNKITMNEVAERVMLSALEMGVDLTFDSNKGPGQKADDSTDNGGTSEKTSEKKSVKAKKSTSASKARAWWKRPYVQIVNYDVATGAFLTKTYNGWERVCDKEFAYREAVRSEPIDLKLLRLEAKEYAADYIRKHILAGKEITDYIPEFIKYFIELRSQGFCEFPGCNKRGCKIHHLKRFCLDPDCDPDGLIFLCEECEKLFHDGVVEGEFGPFENFKIKEDYVPQTKGEKERAQIDQKVQSWRQSQRKLAKAYPLPRRSRRKMRYQGSADGSVGGPAKE